MIVSLILTLVAVILAVVLALENTTMVQVSFFGLDGSEAAFSRLRRTSCSVLMLAARSAMLTSATFFFISSLWR